MASTQLPNVGQYNAKFMQNNPQFGSASNPYGSAPGITAKNPAANIKQPANTIPPKQANPPTTGGAGVGSGTAGGGTSNASTGYIGNPQAFASYSGLSGIGNNGSPQVQAAQDELKRYQQAYANANAGVGMGGTDFNYAQGTEQNIANQYQQGLLSRQTALNNALQQQGQQISALGNAGSLAANQQVSPGNFVIGGVTGRDVTGGSVNPFAGGQRLAGVAAGQAYTNNNIAIEGARGLGNQFVSSIAANPDFNPGSVNFINSLNQLLQNNYSNPNYPGIQSTFNNIINQYAQVLGGRDQVTALITAAKPSSMQALISSLDQQAGSINNAYRTAGQGGGISTPLNPAIQSAATQANAPAAPQNQPQSFTRPNGQVVHLQADGTYQ